MGQNQFENHKKRVSDGKILNILDFIKTAPRIILSEDVVHQTIDTVRV